MYTIYKKLVEKQHKALHKAAYILQVVVITYNKEIEVFERFIQLGKHVIV